MQVLPFPAPLSVLPCNLQKGVFASHSIGLARAENALLCLAALWVVLSTAVLRLWVLGIEGCETCLAVIPSDQKVLPPSYQLFGI